MPSASRRTPSEALLATALLAAWSLINAVTGDSNETAALAAQCSRFHAYEPGIATDLLPWYDDEGISEALMDFTLSTRTMAAHLPGLPLCIRGGKLYVIQGSAQSIDAVWEWQADNIVVYTHALRRLVERWGTALPDVEFVVETNDQPFQDLADPAMERPDTQGPGATPGRAGVWDSPHGRLPVMRHCKTATSLEITVPIFHFYTVAYDEQYLSPAEQLSRELPWESRSLGAFAAGTNYHREQKVASTTRHFDGKQQYEKVEHIRAAFSEYLTEELRHPHINYSKDSVPLKEWAAHRMVMHVDGITCSSRVWQLLALGSVVLREQSGYFAFYDKLLTKFIHYVPFWSSRPREVVWAFNWVRDNEAAARAVAARGQLFAREYLNRDAIECYWVMLLQQYARLLRFRPGTRSGGELELMPVNEWLEKQDGIIRNWPRGRVTGRGNNLNLLPLRRPGS